MNIEMYENYYNYKIKTVYQYSILLSKILGIDKNKLWHNHRDLEKSLNKIVGYYFERLSKDSIQEKNIVRCFINYKDIFKFGIDKELYAIINYFTEEERIFELRAYEKEIILAASILNIANKIDIATSPYESNKNNYRTILNGLIDKYNKIEFINIIDDKHQNREVLLELIKTNVRKERRIFELLNSNTSFNRYVDISLENNYYLTQYNYSVLGIKDADKKAATAVYEKDGIDHEFALMSADLIIVTLMKLLSVRKFNKIFFLPLKSKFFEKDDYIKALGKINDNKFLKRNFKVLINYHEASDVIKEKLNKYCLDYYIYASKNTTIEEKENEFKNEKYLISKDFYQGHKEFIDTKKEEKENIIIEAFDGMVTDRMIIEEG